MQHHSFFINLPLYSKVINAFADLNTWAPNLKKEMEGKKSIFNLVKYFYEKLYLTL